MAKIWTIGEIRGLFFGPQIAQICTDELLANESRKSRQSIRVIRVIRRPDFASGR